MDKVYLQKRFFTDKRKKEEAHLAPSMIENKLFVVAIHGDWGALLFGSRVQVTQEIIRESVFSLEQAERVWVHPLCFDNGAEGQLSGEEFSVVSLEDDRYAYRNPGSVQFLACYLPRAKQVFYDLSSDDKIQNSAERVLEWFNQRRRQVEDKQ